MDVLLSTLAVFLLLGIPIAYALGLSGLCYFWVHQPALTSVLAPRLLAGMDSYAMIALPLFILMGLIMNAGGITSRLIDFSMLFVGRLRGGLGAVNVLASMVFGGISGSSVSDTASVGAALIPAMIKKGYSPRFACGITVASSTMGMVIPPSVPMIIYALVSEQSVGKLFLGGLIPGLMIGVFMLAITICLSHVRKYPREDIVLSRPEKILRVRQSLLALIMPLFVVGAVVGGVATATESAGIGVLYAMLIGGLALRSLKWKQLPELMKQSIMTSANVMIIIGLSKLYIWILALERVPQLMSGFVSELDLPVFVILIIINLIILATGTFVDVSPAILLLAPVFLPCIEALGVSPIQFGVILISGLAVGLVTPPVGMCLNVASAISGRGIGDIFKGAAPFLAANIATLALITFIPELTLWLPNIFYK